MTLEDIQQAIARLSPEERVVVSPLDAIRSYSCSGVDALILDNFLLSKAPIPTSAPVRETPAANVSA